jgi:alkanesulfonate monooxygenase SsuD/methylene tetrahydromethanopterin reductase-like flavin-dependent oxidoreductase (luciferase family)
MAARMDIGVGLPSHIPGAAGKTVVEWARRADAHGFASLAVIDRIVYGSYEPLIALGAAAAVTERARLVTSILIGPLRTNTALLAKQVATLDVLSNGRVELGIAVGGREDDFTASGAGFKGRGQMLERQIVEMRKIWAGESRGTAGAIGPTPGRAPRIIMGGQTDAALKRAARLADGWIMGGGATPEGFGKASAHFKAIWSAQGRKEKPRLLALGYYAIGTQAAATAKDNLRDYYKFAGPYAEQVASSVLSSDAEIGERIAGLEQAGCDELLLLPGLATLEQVDLLAAAVFPRRS